MLLQSCGSLYISLSALVFCQIKQFANMSVFTALDSSRWDALLPSDSPPKKAKRDDAALTEVLAADSTIQSASAAASSSSRHLPASFVGRDAEEQISPPPAAALNKNQEDVVEVLDDDDDEVDLGQSMVCPNLQQWKTQVPEPVLRISRTHEMFKEMMQCPRVFSLQIAPKSVHAGQVLRHCISWIDDQLKHQNQLFKIGITHLPFKRWYLKDRSRPEKSYCKAFRRMSVIAVSESRGFIAMLEAALILHFTVTNKALGCQNLAPGGENSVGQPPFFCYLAHMTLS